MYTYLPWIGNGSSLTKAYQLFFFIFTPVIVPHKLHRPICLYSKSNSPCDPTCALAMHYMPIYIADVL